MAANPLHGNSLLRYRDGLNKKQLKYQGRGVLMATKDIHRGSVYGVDYSNPEFCLV